MEIMESLDLISSCASSIGKQQRWKEKSDNMKMMLLNKTIQRASLGAYCAILGLYQSNKIQRNYHGESHQFESDPNQ